MFHKIFIGPLPPQELLQRGSELFQTSLVSPKELETFDSVRSFVDGLLTYWSNPDKKTIQIIPTAGFSALKLTLFLKALESEGGFVLWFYGSSLSVYPRTFLSRCVIERERVEETTQASAAVLSERDVFMDFLYNLDAFKAENFNNLYVFLQRSNEMWLELLRLFLDNSPIFTSAHLKVCSFLRTPEIRLFVKSQTHLNFRFILMWLMTKKVVG